MRKAQKNFNFLKISIHLILILYSIILIFNLHAFFIKIFIYYPLISIIIPIWFLKFLFFLSNKIFGVNVKKETKHKIVFYSLFLTFLLLYFNLLPNFGELILSTTTPRPTTTTTTPTSIPKCNSTSPTVTVLTPLVPSASSLKVSVTFSCQEWNYTIRDLKLTLYIDNNKWNECFLNETAGLVTYFGWNGTQMDDASPHCIRGCQSCGNNGRWDCDNKMNCKFRDAYLWVYSNSTSRFVNITFTCKLPPLSSGTHTLTVRPVIYHSLIEMKPSKTTFMVTLPDENSILRSFIQPFKVLLRIIFPF
jgi:hypothetical protein